jgi:hypothetical protein
MQARRVQARLTEGILCACVLSLREVFQLLQLALILQLILCRQHALRRLDCRQLPRYQHRICIIFVIAEGIGAEATGVTLLTRGRL